MSSFLMVVPDGWTEIPNPEAIAPEEEWGRANPWEVTEWLKTAGHIVDGQAALEMRYFRDSGVLRMWVVIGPEQ